MQRYSGTGDNGIAAPSLASLVIATHAVGAVASCRRRPLLDRPMRSPRKSSMTMKYRSILTSLCISISLIGATAAHADTRLTLYGRLDNGIEYLHGVTDAAMEGLYAYAYRFYQQGKLKEAESFFRFLFMYDFRCAEYPMGLAAVYQLRGEYVKAIEYYAIAGSLAKDDLRPIFHAAQCHLCLGNRAAARRNFEQVLAQAELPILRETAKSCLEVMAKDSSLTEAEPTGDMSSP